MDIENDSNDNIGITRISEMRLRGARGRDFKILDRLYEDINCELDINHIQSMVVVEDNNGSIIAAGTFTTLLEGAFVTDKQFSRRDRVAALRMILKQAEIELHNLGFNSYHVFTTNESITAILKRKFGFVLGKGINLLKAERG
jgi:hypothetical protein